MGAIEELTRSKTAIMIAHRLKTVQGAGQILVVDDGRIVQRGTHDELLAQEGGASASASLACASTLPAGSSRAKKDGPPWATPPGGPNHGRPLEGSWGHVTVFIPLER